jgi:uncharacterized membrane protein YcgQ (UPF0703/DUF1980 family)
MRCKECADCELYKRQQKFEEMKRNGELFYIEDKPIKKDDINYISLMESIRKDHQK